MAVDEEMLATLAEVHAEEWTRPEHLIAALIDAVNVSAHNALIGPHVDPKKLRRVRPPKPIERPGARRRRRRATGEEMAAFFGRMQRGGDAG